jgi:hypothetical protein
VVFGSVTFRSGTSAIEIENINHETQHYATQIPLRVGAGSKLDFLPEQN